MKIVLPCRGEFGLKVCYHVPAVHAIGGPKVVCIEPGEEALYPSAHSWDMVPRNMDDKRRGTHPKTEREFNQQIRERYTNAYSGLEFIETNARMEREYFQPAPYIRQGVECDVVVCPRKRKYGSEKNWPMWADLTDRLVRDGLGVFAGGAPDSSENVPCERAWDWDRYLDATIEALRSARLCVATDAGLAHLAVLCGTPLLMITHGAGLVAPGAVLDDLGRAMEPQYWPVKMKRYTMANHTGSPVELLHDAWFDLMLVHDAVRRRCSP